MTRPADALTRTSSRAIRNRTQIYRRYRGGVIRLADKRLSNRQPVERTWFQLAALRKLSPEGLIESVRRGLLEPEWVAEEMERRMAQELFPPEIPPSDGNLSN